MKPFNLAEALAGKPVVTRTGKKIVELHQWQSIKRFPVSVVMEGGGVCYEYTLTGNFYDTGSHSPEDLFMAPAKVTGWIAFGSDTCSSNKFPAPYTLVGIATHVWPTREQAEEAFRITNLGAKPKGVVEVYWEEY